MSIRLFLHLRRFLSPTYAAALQAMRRRGRVCVDVPPAQEATAPLSPGCLAATAGQSISSDADELGCCVAGTVVAPCTCRACSAAACIWATWAMKAYGSEEPGVKPA